MNDVLCVIPARGGSKGLPSKNLRSLGGLPLIAHSILLAQRCPDVARVVVSTDSREIASTAREFGAEVPFMRPAELAEDETAMWPVIRHAVHQLADSAFQHVLLLDPTTVGRLPGDIAGAASRLRSTPDADGIVGVSQPDFNPLWHCVVDRGGWMVDLFEHAARYKRRQDVPVIYRINASLYLWRREYVERSVEAEGWRQGRLLMFEVPDWRIVHIDTAHEFERVELLVRHRVIELPWIDQPVA